MSDIENWDNEKLEQLTKHFNRDVKLLLLISSLLVINLVYIAVSMLSN